MKDRTCMHPWIGRLLEKRIAASRPGSVERIGFKRSDPRHPKHPNHLKRCHADDECDCNGPLFKQKAIVAVYD